MHTLWLSICGSEDFILEGIARYATAKLHFDPPNESDNFCNANLHRNIF